MFKISLSAWTGHHSGVPMKLIFWLKAATLAVFSVCFLLSVPLPANAFLFTMNFDETGACSWTSASNGSGSCTGSLVSDPSATPLTNDPVWVFNLPSATYTGQVNVLDPNGDISDRLRFIDSSGSFLSCIPTSGLSVCADRLIFYSFDDVTPLGTLGDTPSSVTEDANGNFSFTPGFCTAGAGNCNVFNGVSPVPGPIVGAGLPGLVVVFGGLIAVARRRRKQAA